MPFQPGNQLSVGNKNAQRQKHFRKTLNRVLNEHADSDAILTSILQKLVQAALDGEPWAIREIADRLDGRPYTQRPPDDETSCTDAPKVIILNTGVPRANDVA